MREMLWLIVAFTPFIVFWCTVGRSPVLATWGALLAAAVLFAVNLLRRRLRTFEIFVLLFFGFFALFFSLTHVPWAERYAAAIVHGGLVVIALTTILIGRPFTMDYARDHAPREIWTTPEFLASNRLISSIWTIGFLTTTAAAVAVVICPADLFSLVVYKIGIPVVGTGGPLVFTLWYSRRIRQRRLAATSANLPMPSRAGYCPPSGNGPGWGHGW